MGSHLVQLVLRRPIQSMQLHSAIQPPLLRPLLRSRRRSRRRMSPPRLMDVPRLMLTAQTVHTHSHSPAWRKDRTRRTIPMPGRMIRAQKRTLTAFRYSPHLTSPHSPCLTSPHLTLTSPHLAKSPHLTSPPPSPHLTLPRLTSPGQILAAHVRAAQVRAVAQAPRAQKEVAAGVIRAPQGHRGGVARNPHAPCATSPGLSVGAFGGAYVARSLQTTTAGSRRMGSASTCARERQAVTRGQTLTQTLMMDRYYDHEPRANL
jgi:hypothetical protein